MSFFLKEYAELRLTPLVKVLINRLHYISRWRLFREPIQKIIEKVICKEKRFFIRRLGYGFRLGSESFSDERTLRGGFCEVSIPLRKLYPPPVRS